MGNTFWVMLGVIAIIAVIAEGIVKIIKASSQNKGTKKEAEKQLVDMESDLLQAQDDIDDARQRIEVLEKIVTDEKYQLNKKFDDLANG